MSKDIFKQLLNANKSTDIEKIMNTQGDRIKWVPLGNYPGNFGVVSMGSQPYDGITERITNSIDAMIELAVESNKEYKKFNNPRKAIEKIYDIKDGYLRWADDKKVGILASDVKVRFYDGDQSKTPTVEIWDRGIGQHPRDFPSTLCSLNNDYKVTKFYLIGAFGQGGQTSFAHCKYGIIISRKHPHLLKKGQEDVVGWTIVRYWNPSINGILHKKGRWEYCVASSTNNVPTISTSTLSVAFSNGTIIRLINYKLPKGTSNVLHASGQGWSFLSQSLFDPVFPIRLFECRNKFENKNRPLPGLARRLWRGGKKSKAQICINDSYDINFKEYGKIKINFWGLRPIIEPGTKSKWRDIKKGLVSRNDAIFITLNGQRHGAISNSFLRDDAKYVYSYDNIIVQIDCDQLTNIAKIELFASTRERLKEGPMKDMLLEELAVILKKDRNLLNFEKEREKEILSERTRMDTTKIKRMVGQLISRNPELSDFIMEESKDKHEKMKVDSKKKEDKTEPEDEIKDKELETPELNEIPTYLKINNKKDPIPIEKGGNCLIRLETDVIDEYLEGENEKRIRCIHKSLYTDTRSHSHLRSGKISYYIHCHSSTRVGSKGAILFEIDLPDGSCLPIERAFVCSRPAIRKKKKKESNLPEPKILSITREDSQWELLGYDIHSVGEVFRGDNPAIIVSIENEHIEKTLRKRKLKEKIVKSTKDRYCAAVAYFLLLREYEKIQMKKRGDEINIDTSANSKELQRMAHVISQLAIPTENI